MTSRDFCYWLQGYFEILASTNNGVTDAPQSTLNANQVACVRNHLNMVFKHEIDPSHGDAAHQQELAAAHAGKPVPPGLTARC